MLGEMRAVAASASAVSAIEAKNQLRRLGPESRAGDQKGFTMCGSCDTCVTVAMSVMSTPRALSTKGTAMLAKPTLRPKGRVRMAQ